MQQGAANITVLPCEHNLAHVFTGPISSITSGLPSTMKGEATAGTLPLTLITPALLLLQNLTAAALGDVTQLGAFGQVLANNTIVAEAIAGTLASVFDPGAAGGVGGWTRAVSNAFLSPFGLGSHESTIAVDGAPAARVQAMYPGVQVTLAPGLTWPGLAQASGGQGVCGGWATREAGKGSSFSHALSAACPYPQLWHVYAIVVLFTTIT